MKKPHQTKILLHGQGTGDLTNDDVEKRAGEIAIIRGSSAEKTSENDRAEAWAELNGELLPGTNGSDQDASGGLSRDPSEPLSDAGHQVVTEQPESDETDARERLATEGVEEAQHDQMLAARQREQRENRT